MKLNRRAMAAAALSATFLLAAAGCKSKTPQANNQNVQNPQQAASAGQETPASQAGSTAAAPAGGQGAAAPYGGSAAKPYAGGGDAAPQAQHQPRVVDLPAGTTLRVRLDEDLGSKISQSGQAFTATIANDVVVNGQIVIPKGARADGTVMDAQPLGRFKGGARLQVKLNSVHTNWGSYPVETSSVVEAEKGKGKRTAVMAGGGTALGALIGGLAGGGKGAAIGAVAGAGAGTAGSAFTGNKQIVLPAETLLNFKLEKTVHVVQGR